MDEEKPIFKLKKTSKTVGGFDVTNNTTEWVMLEKLPVNDLPSFVHMQRLWVREETEDIVDADGNITSKGFKKESVVLYYSGFIKDDKYVVTENFRFPCKTDHEAQQFFLKQMNKLSDNGYKMVECDQQHPTYYTNERTPMIPSNIREMITNLAQAATQHNTIKSNPIMKIALSQKFKSQKP
jgi:hypothetical protein